MKTPFATMRSWKSKIFSTPVTIYLLLQSLRMSHGHHLVKDINNQVATAKYTVEKHAPTLDQVAYWTALDEEKGHGETVDAEPSSLPPVILPSSSTTKTTQDKGTFRDDEDDEDGEQRNGMGVGAVAAGAGAAPNPLDNILSTPIFLQLLPQVANFVGNLATGNRNSHATPSFVGSVANLLPTPIGNQLMGLVQIINPGAGSPSPNRHVGGQRPPAPHAGPPLASQPVSAMSAPDVSNNVVDGTRVGGTGFLEGIPPSLLEGLPAADIAFLQSHGLPDLNTLGAATTPRPPRSTRRPRPNEYKPVNQQQQPSTPPQTILEEPIRTLPSQPIPQLINPSQFGQQLNQILHAQPNLAAVLEQELQSLKQQNLQQSNNVTSGVTQEGQGGNNADGDKRQHLTPEQQQVAQFHYFKLKEQQSQQSQVTTPQSPTQEQSTWSQLPQKPGETFFQLQRQPIFPPFRIRPGPGPNIDEDDSDENE